MTTLQKNKLFKLLGTHTYNYSKNQEILPTLKSENIICILLEGFAQIVNISYNGEETIVENIYEENIFGTNISDINNNEFQIRAVENCKLLVIDYNKLSETNFTGYNYYNIFINNLFDIVNSKLKEKNDRIRILSKKTIREKLLEYFESQYQKTHSKFIYLPNSFKDLSDYFAINRSAMFRELKNLKEENFIKIDGKKITLLYTPELN